VYLGYRPHTGIPGQDVWADVPRNPAELQVAVITPSPAWSIDNTAGAYFLWIPTGAGSGWQVSVWSARVAYTTPSSVFMPVIQR
jgi:hypothetical protein